MQQIQKLLSRYRDEIKGIAILWVVFFHTEIAWSGLGYEIMKIGYGGVDMLLFLMGYGLYYSLNKNSDLGAYCKRRAWRLLPAYIPFCIVWLVVMLPKSFLKLNTMEKVSTAVANLTMSAFFANQTYINWFISMLAMVILLAPFFYLFLKEGKRWELRAIGLLSFLLVLGFAYIKRDQNIVVSRLPIFSIGMMFAHPCKEVTNWKKRGFFLLVAGTIGLIVLYGCFAWLPDLLSDYAMLWYPFVLITPALCVGLGCLFDRLPPKALVPLRVMGVSSFEIFLFNAWIERWGGRFWGFWRSWEKLLPQANSVLQRSLGWVFLALFSIVCGILYHYVVKKMLCFMQGKIKM